MQQRVGLGLRLLDQPEGVVDHDRDHAESGDHRRDVVRVEFVLVDDEHGVALDEPRPRHQVQRQRQQHERGDQLEALQPHDDEERGGRGEILQMQAGIAADVVGEREDADQLRERDGQRAGQLAIAVQKRDRQRDGGHHEIDQDHRLPGVEVEQHRLLQHVDEREGGHRIGRHVHNLETPADARGVALGAIAGKTRN